MAKIPTNNAVVVSDIHAGCKFGLCPSREIDLADGGTYKSSKMQRIVWGWWKEFWNEWVPLACHKEPFSVIMNGEGIDGVHHGSTTPISHNLEDQKSIAVAILKPIVEMCEGRFYYLSGTPVHSGQSGVDDEGIAKTLGAVKDKAGRHARYELRGRLGRGLVQVCHQIGGTSSDIYESTAILKELISAYVEAGKNRRRPPDVVVRSHRHRNMEIRLPTKLGYGISFCTAAWQLKTPYVYRGTLGRTSPPQIGGSVIRQGDEDLYTRHKIWMMDPPAEEVL